MAVSLVYISTMFASCSVQSTIRLGIYQKQIFFGGEASAGSKNTGQRFFAGRKQRSPDLWSNNLFLAGLEDGIEGPAEEVGVLHTPGATPEPKKSGGDGT